MDNHFFERPILNSPYSYPERHWELDSEGQPTQKIVATRRRAEFITPIPKPKKQKRKPNQDALIFDEGKGLSTQKQQYDPTSIINDLRFHVDQWRKLLNPTDWLVTPETERLLQHWRHHNFNSFRPFFCQLEAVETAIWLTEVAPKLGKSGKRFLEHLANANHDANPDLMRLALKLATGDGKTTVMAMIIAWQTIADMACERITAGIGQTMVGTNPGKVVLDPYNPTGSTAHVKFNTSRADRWQTDARRCHINWVILDSDWEAEFCRVAESHPRVKAYVKNHNLGLEVPYRYGSETRKYLPDFVVLVDDGHGDDDVLHLIVEIKGYRREDAKEKKATMDTYWVPGVNHLRTHGRWAFAEFREVYQIESDFEAKVEGEFNKMIE